MDIVGRLRMALDGMKAFQATPSRPALEEIVDEAAREIDRLRQENADLYRHHRWNIEEDGDALLICRRDHEKSEPCNYVRYVPAGYGTVSAQKSP